MTDSPNFQLNGRSVSLADADPTETLLRFLKRQRLTGTKEGCADGDCGACTVAMIELDASDRAHYRAVNSCLLPMGALPGREILTVEALSEAPPLGTAAVLHPVQQAMVDCAGSQCGYCTPGFVMSLFAGFYSGEFDDGVFEGNLCRCTGYKPIREAAQLLGTAEPAFDHFQNALTVPRETPDRAVLGQFFSPTTVTSALTLKAQHPDAVWIAGATDLGVNLSHGQTVASAFIALDRIAELTAVSVRDVSVRIGASASLSTLEREVAGVFPALDQMLGWFAARQVRNRATIGGNLGTASPIGDLSPVLLALDAQVSCCGRRGARTIPIDEFFLDYRSTALAADEMINAVTLPRRDNLISASYKVAKRQTDDISIVAAVFALVLDEDKRVSWIRLAYGGVAATPLRAKPVEEFLVGRTLDEDTVARACEMLQGQFNPLSDHRASADYRRKLCGNLFAKFVIEHCQ